MKPILAGLAACLMLTACSSNEEAPAPQAVPVQTITVKRQRHRTARPGRTGPHGRGARAGYRDRAAALV